MLREQCGFHEMVNMPEVPVIATTLISVVGKSAGNGNECSEIKCDNVLIVFVMIKCFSE